MTTDHLYPAEAFRSWEDQRMHYDTAFAQIVSDLVNTEIGESPLLLDVASGEGYGTYLLELAESNANIVSVDLDEESLSNDRWLPADEDAMRAVSSAEKLSFKKNSFDGVLSISGLHTIDPEIFPDIVSEVHRVLQTGGKLVLTNDTPRGLSYIFSDPLLMEVVHTEPDETVIATYDVNGDICQPVVVKSVALDRALEVLCRDLGIEPLTSEQYIELMQSDGGEVAFVDLYAQAAGKCLVQKAGYRPFEYNSNGGSWNKYFFSNIMDDIKSSCPGLKVRTERFESSTTTGPVVINSPNGKDLFVKRFRRDSVGNLYVAEFSTEPVDSTIVDIKAQFIIAEKV